MMTRSSHKNLRLLVDPVSFVTLLFHRETPDIFHLRNSFVVVAPTVFEVVLVSLSILFFEMKIGLPYVRPHAASDTVLVYALLPM